MNKKTIIITILIVFFALVAVFAWLYISLTNSNTDPTPNTPITNTGPLSPFGTSNTNPRATSSTPATNIGTTNRPGQVLRMLSAEPVVSGTSIDKSTTTVVRFIERATGHIYETGLNESEIRRISNTTIPKIYNALWSADASSLVLQFLKEDNNTIQTFVAKLAVNQATSTKISASVIQGVSLGENLKGVVASNDKNNVLFLVSDIDGVSGITSRFDGNLKKKVFGVSAKEWQISWPTADLISMTTKPNARINGFSYLVNKNTGLFNKIAENIPGLTVSINKDASYALIGKGGLSSTNISVLNLKTGAVAEIETKTLPEKCIWSVQNPSTAYCAVPNYIPTVPYPDSWYQGLVSFSDSLWKIDASKGSASLIRNFQEEDKKDLDIVGMEITKNEQYLLFLNKTDLSYWSLKI
jgi:hypothetical protein